jgi:Icc-related predicted phosphoesterase
MEEVVINVYNIVGNSLCIASDDGEKVYEQIKKALNSDRIAIISFLNVDMLTSAFLNSAIGQLYRDFSEEQIERQVKFADIDPDDLATLERVKNTAKLFYKDPERLRKSIEDIMDD